MLPIAFTESIELRKHLRDIDEFRSQILCMPLTPKNELKLRWEAQITRIHGTLGLAHIPISRGQIIKLLSSPTKHIPSEYTIVLDCKRAFDYIHETWTANTKTVTIQTIIALADMLHLFPNALERKMQESDGPIRATLEYLQSQSDHPVIQSGIALCMLSTNAPIAGDTGIVARLAAWIFLAKYGYDVRTLLTAEKNWLASEQSYETALESLRRDSNLNHWLLYYSQTISDNLRERTMDLINPKVQLAVPANFWELNDRQKSILTFISEPGSSITNKKVQSLCNVSQITASRDLSKLSLLGLATVHGKGRSVSYTRS